MPDVALVPTYTLRPAMMGGFGLLDDLHVACMKPYVEATWGWDEAIGRATCKANPTPEQEGGGR